MMGGFYQRTDCCGLWQAHGGEGCRNCPCPPLAKPRVSIPAATDEQIEYFRRLRESHAAYDPKAMIGGPPTLDARANHIAEEAQGSGCWHVVRDRALQHLREVEAIARRTPPERTDTSARREYGDDGGAGCVG